jgi:hypothetical protein
MEGVDSGGSHLFHVLVEPEVVGSVASEIVLVAIEMDVPHLTYQLYIIFFYFIINITIILTWLILIINLPPPALLKQTCSNYALLNPNTPRVST